MKRLLWAVAVVCLAGCEKNSPHPPPQIVATHEDASVVVTPSNDAGGAVAAADAAVADAQEELRPADAAVADAHEELGQADAAGFLDATTPAQPDAGRPLGVSPPEMTVFCAATQSPPSCNNFTPLMLGTCYAANFGNVGVNDPPCELLFEIMNQSRTGGPTEDLVVTQIEIWVQDINALMTRNGFDIGFSLLDEAGNVLTVDAAHPIRVAIRPGESWATQAFHIRYTHGVSGVWYGASSFAGTGIRIYSNDPDHAPSLSVSLSVDAQ